MPRKEKTPPKLSEMSTIINAQLKAAEASTSKEIDIHPLILTRELTLAEKQEKERQKQIVEQYSPRI